LRGLNFSSFLLSNFPNRGSGIGSLLSSRFSEYAAVAPITKE